MTANRHARPRRPLGRWGTAGLLVQVDVTAITYVMVEDDNVGHAYSQILHHNPNLIPAYLTAIAALHIQTGVAVAQICLTAATPLLLATRHETNAPDDHSLALAESIGRMAEVLDRLTDHDGRSAGPEGWANTRAAEHLANGQEPDSPSSPSQQARTQIRSSL